METDEDREIWWEEKKISSCKSGYLHLSGSQIAERGCIRIFKRLETNQTITSLRAGYNTIGDEGCKALANTLKTNRFLTSIWLTSSSIGVEGCKALAQALEINQSVTDISLQFNPIGDEGVAALVKVLETNHTLQYLELGLRDYNIELETPLSRNREYQYLRCERITLLTSLFGFNAIIKDTPFSLYFDQNYLFDMNILTRIVCLYF
jgi:hypothetical protein